MTENNVEPIVLITEQNKIRGEVMMKKTILIAIGIAGMLFGTPLADAQAAHVGAGVSIRLGGKNHHHHRRHWHKKRYRHAGLSITTAAMKQV
jgi:hypothetical protein